MSDLHTRLDEIAGPAVAPSTATVDADLSRGRRALRRRRTGQLVAGSSFVATAVLAAALAVSGASTGGGSAPGAIPGASTGGSSTSTDSGGVSTGAATKLVAYTGKQPAGFTLDQVPEGWEVLNVDQYGLTLAPKGAPTAPAPTNGATPPPEQDPRSCVGKICVMLSRAVPDVPKKDVRVGDKPGVLATMKGDKDGRTLFVKQPSGTYLTIQVWDGLGWGEKDIVQFGAGVHVNEGAGLTVG